MTTVGVIANPASGRDVRRLTSGASVFDNAEKGAMVARLAAGLAAAGVERILLMPAGDGVADSLRRHLAAPSARSAPDLEVLPAAGYGDARDTAAAVAAMAERDVAAIVVLGGDGTARAVAAGCGDIPLCTLSTGTNNAFPQVREATVAGLATGLVATGRVGGDGVLRREKRLDVRVGTHTRVECALVDVAWTASRFVGARALWRVEDLASVVVAFASPSAVGLSALAGQLEAVPRSAPHGLHVRLAPLEQAASVATVALAPGLVTRIGVAEVRRLNPGERVRLEPGPGCVALDGEREVELGEGEVATVALGRGPLVIDIDIALAVAARDHAFIHHQREREGAA
jgi:predicted polyphosphate/ATP-dependent NAD kinase